MILRKFLLILNVFAFFPQIVAPAFAQDDAAGPLTACDPEYMDALEARAWLEAQREIMQNANLISKPDSVLEYTCFPSLLNELGAGTGSDGMFSEHNPWKERHGTLNTALDAVVRTAVASYLEANFSHTFLGGRATNDYTMPGSVEDASYTCNSMQVVWQEAKCMNMHQFERDAFFDFGHYSDDANDPREMPDACSAGIGAVIADGLTAAFNEAPGHYVLGVADGDPENNPIDDGTPYESDPIVTHLEFILPMPITLPDGSTMNCDDITPIATGVMVNRGDSDDDDGYPDGVCPNPGCHLSADGTTCEAG